MSREVRSVTVGLRHPETPGAIAWDWSEEIHDGVTVRPASAKLRGLGLNPELEAEAIARAQRSAYLGEQVTVNPNGRGLDKVEASLEVEDFPRRVVATLLSATPGRSEVLDIVPKEAINDIQDEGSAEFYLASIGVDEYEESDEDDADELDEDAADEDEVAKDAAADEVAEGADEDEE